MVIKNNILKFFFLIPFLLFLEGCGYVSDRPPENIDVFKTDKLQACKIDIEKLGQIFKENQEEQIRCLKENFIQYTKYVKNNNTDSVNQNEIGDFVKKIFQGQSDSIIKGLSIIFQLNMILLRDEAQKISKGNITPLFELLVTANREAIIITSAIKEIGEPKNQERFFEIREKFTQALKRFANATLTIMQSTNGKDQKLNIKNFLIDASKKIGNKEIDPNLMDGLFFLKQILVSGEKEIISTRELEKLIQKIPDLLTFTFDIYYSDHTNFNNKDSEQSKFYLGQMRNLKEKIIDFNQPDISLITIDQLINFAKSYYEKSEFNLDKFRPSLLIIKKKIIGGDSNIITLLDIKKMLEIMIDINEKVFFDHVTYDIREELLTTSSTPLSDQDLGPIKSSEYEILSPQRITELTKNFNQLAVEFRYFRKSSKGLALYGPQYFRPRYGVVEQSLTRWIANKIILAYGHKGSKQEMLVSLEEFQTFLVDMRPILEELKLWSPKFETFARNAILLADLFQHQSNGDLMVNEREATEYITMLLSASLISDNHRKNLTQFCDPGINKDDPLFDVGCFNERFFDLFLNRLNYKVNFPKLKDYIKKAGPEEALSYLQGLEGFARDINDPKVPINKRDSILIFGSVVNVESTFIRFDKNSDNLIDYYELMDAFKIYKNSIISLAKLKPEQIEYAPSIFLYMASKMEVPPTSGWLDNLKFYAFHKCVQSESCRLNMLDPIFAKRLNIGSLLYYLVNQGNKQTANISKKPIH